MPAVPVSAEQHQALLVQVAGEGIGTHHQQPQAEAKLAAIDQERI